MPQPRASRLAQQAAGGKPPWLADYLPVGSWQRRIVFWAAIPLLLILIVILLVDNVVMPTVTRQGAAFELPDLTQMSVDDAEIELEELGLTYEITAREFSPGEPEGIVLAQNPIPGTAVKPDRIIRFVVSLGQKLIAIPDVSGRSVRQAILDLETEGLELGEIAWAFSDTIPERVVVFSYPEAGREIPLGSPVNLMVNRGRASSFTFVPDLVGLTLGRAEMKLAEKSLRVGVVTRRLDENYLPETILEQSEPVGAEVDINAEIDLVVSTSEPNTIP